VTLGFLASLYPWTKAIHVIAVIAWMAGMLYLPRLYVYHCDLRPGSAESERFKVMERRLLRQIINPAMIASWLFGIILGLVACEAWCGASAVRFPWGAVPLAAGFSARPQLTVATLLSNCQRGADASDDRHCGDGHRPAFLTPLILNLLTFQPDRTTCSG
jgi:uncharacterized membrane protein